jgi:hypothetical protein
MYAPGSVLVPVVRVLGVAVHVVKVIGVVVVGHGLVTTVSPVPMRMVVVHDMERRRALVPVPFVVVVRVAVVQVVRVVAVEHGDVPTRLIVFVLVDRMGVMGIGRHLAPFLLFSAAPSRCSAPFALVGLGVVVDLDSLPWSTASRAIRATWASARE